MLDPNGCDSPRTHVTCNAVAAHLNIMGDRRRRSRQGGPAQTRRCNADPVVFDKQVGLGHGKMALPAGLMLRVGCYGRMSFERLRPAAPGMTDQALNPGKVRLLDFVRDQRR